MCARVLVKNCRSARVQDADTANTHFESSTRAISCEGVVYWRVERDRAETALAPATSRRRQQISSPSVAATTYSLSTSPNIAQVRSRHRSRLQEQTTAAVVRTAIRRPSIPTDFAARPFMLLPPVVLVPGSYATISSAADMRRPPSRHPHANQSSSRTRPMRHGACSTRLAKEMPYSSITRPSAPHIRPIGRGRKGRQGRVC